MADKMEFENGRPKPTYKHIKTWSEALRRKAR
jgi:hypothetical protein